MNIKKQAGFSLIELLIVLAIIGILAGIALPAYLTYVSRSKVSEGLSLAAGLKLKTAEYYNDNGGAFPVDRASLGLGPATDTSSLYVASIDVENGSLLIQFGNQVGPDLTGQFLVINAFVNGDSDVVFVCGDGVPPAGMTRPVAPLQLTTVPNDLLPGPCKT